MILSLFDYSANMVKPWLDDHDCIQVDTQLFSIPGGSRIDHVANQ